MSVILVSEYVPAEKFKQFHDLLCHYRGSYKTNPHQYPETVSVSYEMPIANYTDFYRDWRRCVTPIKETYRNQWWRCALRRIGVKC